MLGDSVVAIEVGIGGLVGVGVGKLIGAMFWSSVGLGVRGSVGTGVFSSVGDGVFSLSIPADDQFHVKDPEQQRRARLYGYERF